MDAKAAVERHATAINHRDLDAYRDSMAFPFTYQNYNGVAFTVEDAASCGVDSPLPWEVIVRSDPDWSHTEFDSIEEVARSESSVVFKIGFRRIDHAGKASPAFDAIWIAIRRAQNWRVQFRHNLGMRQS